jgi:hypothetical protein
MGIGIYAHQAPEPERRLVPPPVQIEPPWVRVDFDRNAVPGAGGQNLLGIDLITRPSRQPPPRYVTEDGRIRIGHGADDALCLCRAVQLELPMNARDDKVEAREDFVRIVERAVGKDV